MISVFISFLLLLLFSRLPPSSASETPPSVGAALVASLPAFPAVSVVDSPPRVLLGDPPSTPPGLSVGCNGGSPYTQAEVRMLYSRFSLDLSRTREQAERFCAVPKPAGWEHFHRCQYAVVEMELLYLYIRAERPRHVLELCSAVGYTTMWVLAALGDNGFGELWSFDAMDTRLAIAMTDLPETLLQRWHFSRGHVDDKVIIPLLEQHTFDRIVMDADHRTEFARWYTTSILSRHISQLAQRRRGSSLSISVHDVFDTDMPLHPLSGEGKTVLEWLSKDVSVASKTCMLLSEVHNEALHRAVAEVRRDALGEEGAARTWGRVPECSLFLNIVP